MLKSNENNVLSRIRQVITNGHNVTMNTFHRIGDYKYSDYKIVTNHTVKIVNKLYKLGFIQGENLDNENFKITAITDKTIQYHIDYPPEFKFD